MKHSSSGVNSNIVPTMICWLLQGASWLFAAPQDFETLDAVSIVKDFESSSTGLAITYGIGFYESELQKTVENGYDGHTAYVARDANGAYGNFYSEDKTNNSKGEQVITVDHQHFRTAGSGVTVRQKYSVGIFRDNIYVAPLVGASLSDQAFFSEILEHASTKHSLENTELNGHDYWTLTATSPIFGLYTFWISKNPERRLIRVEIVKNAQHELRTIDGHRKKLGDPYPVNEKRLKELPKEKHANYLKSLRDVPSQQKEVYCFEQYKPSPNGKSFPRLVTRSISSKFASTEIFIGISFSIVNIEPFVVADPLLAKFKRFTIPNGTAVTVVGQEGLAWKYDNGTIVRSVDSDAIDSLNGVRFRKPQAPYGFYVLFAAVISLSLWLAYRRWRSA